jgi:RNA polymerase sigma-70 factor, ECF subfamily
MANSADGDTYATRASIFERIRAGDSSQRDLAWADFRAKYAPIIGGFAAKLGATRQDIDDIIQDVMLGFFNVSDEFRYTPERGRFRGFLKVCTMRAARRRAGRNLKFQGIPLERVPPEDAAVDPIWNDVWERELLARALAAVRVEIGSSVAFKAFEQYVLLDRPAEVVAAELETSVNNVHQAKTRVTKQLRETLQRLRELED